MDKIQIRNRSNDELVDLMIDGNACEESQKWIGSRDLRQALADLEKPAWAVWLSGELASKCGREEPALIKAFRMIKEAHHNRQIHAEQADNALALEQEPIWREFYKIKTDKSQELQAQNTAEMDAAWERHASQSEREMIRRRHDARWNRYSQDMDAQWQETRKLLKPSEDRRNHKFDVLSRAMLRYIRRRIEVVED